MAAASRFCPYCGSSNSSDFNFCANCHRQLPPASAGDPTPSMAPTYLPSPTARPFLAAGTFDVGPRAGGLVFVYIGLPLLIFGILALVGASLASSGTASYNQQCSKIPQCTPQADPSGTFAAAGVLLLLLGIGFMVWGISQYNRVGG